MYLVDSTGNKIKKCKTQKETTDVLHNCIRPHEEDFYSIKSGASTPTLNSIIGKAQCA